MTIVNSAFTVNGSTYSDAVAVAAGSTVTLAVQSLTGVSGIVWSIVGNDNRARANPTITPAGSPPGSTASFAVPADPGDSLGQSYRIQCVVSDGGSPANRSTSVAVVGVQNANGIVPFSYGEDLDRHPQYGWTEPANRLLATTARAELYSTAQQSILATAADPGWNVVGAFSMPATQAVRLQVIGAVSDASLTMTSRLYCITAGLVGEVASSRAIVTSVTDVQVYSSSFILTGGNLYQVQTEVTGNVGDDYFGYVRRAAPTGL